MSGQTPRKPARPLPLSAPRPFVAAGGAAPRSARRGGGGPRPSPGCCEGQWAPGRRRLLTPPRRPSYIAPGRRRCPDRRAACERSRSPLRSRRRSPRRSPSRAEDAGPRRFAAGAARPLPGGGGGGGCGRGRKAAARREEPAAGADRLGAASHPRAGQA